MGGPHSFIGQSSETSWRLVNCDVTKGSNRAPWQMQQNNPKAAVTNRCCLPAKSCKGYGPKLACLLLQLPFGAAPGPRERR